ncbi:hypothetical protein [Arenibaculum pallidiluteum]|uniref:hypothetical protein n=1 Tax=Arenibaculum pallidiluteum TaxID=2812559 RepID=UPI001A96B20C|nr:hypothetical protein [Arenibaculum pallidiluteum]
MARRFGTLAAAAETRASSLALLLAAILATVAGASARAEPVTLEGVTFSDEFGGFRILSGSGSGTPQDPFVVVEEITDAGEAVLVIRGAPERTPRNPRRNRILSGHDIGFALRKVVINRTEEIWPGYDLELQSIPGRPSPQDDGLSFGQGSMEQRRIRADAYETATVTSEPIDLAVFDKGDVLPGGRVVLDLVITDMVDRPAIYLVQRRQRFLSELR